MWKRWCIRRSKTQTDNISQEVSGCDWFDGWGSWGGAKQMPSLHQRQYGSTYSILKEKNGVYTYVNIYIYV